MLMFAIELEGSGQMDSLQYNQENLYIPLYFDSMTGMI